METCLPCYSDLMFFWSMSHTPMGFRYNTNVSAYSIKTNNARDREKNKSMPKLRLVLCRNHLAETYQ